MSLNKKDYLFEIAVFENYGSSGDNSENIKKLTKKLKNALDTDLTPTQREIVISYYFEGKNILQIASEKGVNKSSVSKVLARARKRLKRVLKYSI